METDRIRRTERQKIRHGPERIGTARWETDRSGRRDCERLGVGNGSNRKIKTVNILETDRNGTTTKLIETTRNIRNVEFKDRSEPDWNETSLKLNQSNL